MLVLHCDLLASNLLEDLVEIRAVIMVPQPDKNRRRRRDRLQQPAQLGVIAFQPLQARRIPA
jgi:hypothetical protein